MLAIRILCNKVYINQSKWTYDKLINIVYSTEQLRANE